MHTVQTKQTVEGIVLNAFMIEKEDNIGKQMHSVQAKERGEGIDPKESVTEKRETAEINRGGFGLGKVVEEQTEEDIMEGYINRLHENLSWMITKKITIEATLNEALSKFLDAEYFVEFKEKLDSLFMVEEVGNQAEKANPGPPKEFMQLQKETRVQQANATIDDPYAPSQYWYSP
ncbi:hypothetical protein L6452_02693 [Arctium lappa]|uniref:Uncharacterized protein n=1 Tax=Arctium lappa TaxID=4217 RepID=A0ACB9FL55_ARCLA|nr:hypothetical protein L6452_02693 [Arctium lappa]